MRISFFSMLAIILFYNGIASKKETTVENIDDCSVRIVTEAKTVATRFPPPSGYNSISKPNSFGDYLFHLPLKQYGTKVQLFDGRLKEPNSIYCSVIDMELDPVDLQQCADAVMRLRGEYLFHLKQFDHIHFNFLSDGKPRYFKDYAKGDLSYTSFRKYMKYIFAYANTRSLKNELIPVQNKNDIMPGDVFIVSGNPYGHAIIVLNVVVNENGEKLFLLGQSYMPAQDTQVLINPLCDNNSPWFSLDTNALETPEWNFEWSALHRFNSYNP